MDERLAEGLPTIDSIETIDVRVPRSGRNRITTSYATLPDAHHALVRVHAGGEIGIGEAPAELWWTGEDAASVRNAISRYLAPALIGAPLDPRAAASAMDAALAANPYAKAAVEMALWDLLGRLLGVGLHVLLGGGGLPVPIKYVIGLTDPAHAREETEWGLAHGFSVLKVKVGGTLAADLTRVTAVVEAAAGKAKVGVDANGGWDLPTALVALEPLAELGVCFLEQPVSASHPRNMRHLTSRSSVPIVAHESVFSVRDAAEAACTGLAHIWALTPSTHGGLVATMDILGIAGGAGIPCLLGSTVELGVATAFLTQIGSVFETIRTCPVPSDVVGPLYHDEDIVRPPVRFEGGAVHLPAGPGLGVELDDDAISRFGVDEWR